MDNPHDLQSLRHDKALHTVKLQSHLADVPDYIIPPSLKRLAASGTRKKRKQEGKASTGSITKTKARYQVS